MEFRDKKLVCASLMCRMISESRSLGISSRTMMNFKLVADAIDMYMCKYDMTVEVLSICNNRSDEQVFSHL